MNARQKAKKYKKLYNQLINSPINFVVNNVNHHTLMVKKIIPEEVAIPCIKDDYYVRECLSRDMAKEISDYIKIDATYEPMTCSYIFAGTLRIVEY